MQISKADFDKLVQERDYLEARHTELRDMNRDQRNQINNFDEILSKIIRAATGQPIVVNRDSVNGMAAGYFGERHGEGHQCQMPGEIEVLRTEVVMAHAVRINLESQIAAAVAVAMFAKEHKS